MNRRQRRRAMVSAPLAGLVLLLGACSGGDSETADPKPVADGSTATTAGPSLGSGDIVANPSATSLSGVGDANVSAATVTAPPATYVVPDIPATSVAEICAGTKQVIEADDQISALLTPVLGADASDAADQALLNALTKVKPFIDDAGRGYDRMAAALPAALATDATSVRDATMTFYGAVTTAQSMDSLIIVLEQAAAFPEAAKEAAARLDATTRKTCNQSLYNK